MMVAFFVVMVVATPAELATRALPAVNWPTMDDSENVKTRLDSASNSMRPVLPRLIIALELAPVAMVLPDRMVELEIAGWPLTVTFPVTVISAVAVFGRAK